MFNSQPHTTLNKENQDFFNEIYLKYRKAIYANIYKLIRDPQGVEDVFQEVFMTLWMNLHKAESVEGIASWLFVVSHNKSVTYLKKKLKASLLSSESEDLAALADLPASAYADTTEEQLLMIRQAVAQLPDKRKEVFRLNKFEGKSVDEIATELDLTPATVKEYLKQSIRLIRSYLKSPGTSSSSIASLLLILWLR